MQKKYSKSFLKLVEKEKDIKNLIEGSHVTMTSSDKPIPYLAMWEKDRKFIAKAIDADGSILDIGSANGFLLRCLMEWSDHKLIPYGIDNDKKHIRDAKKLIPGFSDNFACQGLEDFLENYPQNFPLHFAFIYWAVWDNWWFNEAENVNVVKALLNHVKPSGKLILGFYNPKKIVDKKINQLKESDLSPQSIIEGRTAREYLAFFSQTRSSTHPLQTIEWADFRREWGNKIVQIPEGFVSIHTIPFTKLKLGMFLKGSEPTFSMVKNLKKLAKDENLIFIKLEPNIRKTSELVNKITRWGGVPGKTFFTPTTFWIDLTRPEEELLKSFSSKTRYNIRLAERRGVTVQEDNSDKAFEEYLRLMAETVARDKFFAHSRRYHKLMWKHLYKIPVSKNQAPLARLMTATYENEVVTAWILFVKDNFLYYPYGASTHKYKNVMANNLMMWEAIKLGKSLRLSTFDLWGREAGKGFTKFKEGYNPEVVEFLGTWDLVINKRAYQLYKSMDYARWLLLRTKSKFSNPRF